jgi:hypothetical protein
MMDTQSWSAYHPAYYPVDEAVAVKVGTVSDYREKRQQAKADSDARKAQKLDEMRVDAHQETPFPALKPALGSMRELLGAPAAPTMRQALGLS